MLERSAFDNVIEIIQPECFYLDAHRRIFSACKTLSQRNSPIDMLTVVEELKRTEELDLIGGPFYISKLTMAVASSANIETHARILLEKHMKREVINQAGKMLHDAYDDSIDVFNLLDNSEQIIFNIANTTLKKPYKSAAQLGFDALQQIEFLRNHPQDLTGVPSGFSSVDRLTCGWQPTDFIILAARPSVGKTSLALNFAVNAADDPYKPTPVGFFSMEMSSSQLIQRVISSKTEIFLEKIRRGRVDDHEIEKITKVVERFDQLPIYIDDTPELNIFELRSRARKMVSKNGVGLIVIDYLQLMKGDGAGNREQEISIISRSLKALAKELNIPIIALSQLSREIEKRKGTGQLSDLRDSGAIEQDADIVAFIYRDDYQQSSQESDPLLRGNSYIDIKKHRQGDLDKLPFKTDLRIQRWFEPDKYEQYIQRWNLGPGNWKPIDQGGAQLFIQSGIDDEAPF